MNGNSPHSTGFDPFLRPLPKKEPGKMRLFRGVYGHLEVVDVQCGLP